MTSPEPDEIDYSQLPWGPPLPPEEDARQLAQMRGAMRQWEADRQAQADAREAENRRIEWEALKNEAEADLEAEA